MPCRIAFPTASPITKPKLTVGKRLGTEMPTGGLYPSRQRKFYKTDNKSSGFYNLQEINSDDIPLSSVKPTFVDCNRGVCSLRSSDNRLESDAVLLSMSRDSTHKSMKSRIPHKSGKQSSSTPLGSLGISGLEKLRVTSEVNADVAGDASCHIVESSSSESSSMTSCNESWEEAKELLTSPIDDDGNTALHEKILQGNKIGALRIIRQARGFDDLNVCNKFGQTPLHLAVLTGQADILRKLMSAGGLVSLQDGDGNSPLHLACLEGRTDLVRHLVTPVRFDEVSENGYDFPGDAIPQDLNIKNDNGQTCVELACENGHVDVLHILQYILD